MTYGRPGVYINERLLPAPIPSAGNANAAGACLGIFPQGPTTVTLVTSWYEFAKAFGGFDNSYTAALGVSLFFKNGGSELYVRRVLHSDAAAAHVTVPDAATGDAFTVTATDVGADGNNLRVNTVLSYTDEVNNIDYYTITVTKEAGVPGTASVAPIHITAGAGDDILLEQFTNVRFDDAASSDYVLNVVNLNSKVITVSAVTVGTTPVSTIIPLANGSNGGEVTVSDFNAAVSDFDTVDRPLVIFAPEIMSDTTVGGLGESNGLTVQTDLVQWATANGKGFAVLDTPPSADTTLDDAVSHASSLGVSSNAAVYYPSIYIQDPLGRGTTSLRKVGNAGAVAGLFLQTDKQSGPFKAPAGITASVRGAVALGRSFTSAELDTLNTGNINVNAIRNLPGSGVVVMGARTLQQDGTANRYVNMRRSLIYIKTELESLTQFALFENNDDVLWRKLRTSIGVFLNTYWNQGGLRGVDPTSAFYVKVDKENNPIESIARGEVHIEVGVALEYPTEFVVINLSQTTGQ